MKAEEIAQIIRDRIGDDAIVEVHEGSMQETITLDKNFLVPVFELLRGAEMTYFDNLSCITGIDLGPEENRMGVVYHLYSIPYGYRVTFKVFIDRETPIVPTLVHVWKTADWMEREVYDMYGIVFEGHPDLRRILLPADWEGYPLRKDYKTQTYYHGIKVDY